jgi:hypothetical protein
MAFASPVAPGRQFGRVVRITIVPTDGAPIVINPSIQTVPGLATPELHVAFSVEKSVTPEPQRATVQIANLSKTTRDLIASYARRPSNVTASGLTVDSRVFHGTRVIVEAGYLGTSAAAIFTGDLASARSRHVSTEWLTTLECGDSEAAISQAECRQSFEPGATALDVITYAVRCLGMTMAPAPVPAAIPAYALARGFVAYGKARETIDAILAGVAPDLGQLNVLARGVAIVGGFFDAFSGTAPLTRPIGWWAEDGAAYFLERGKALPGEAVRVTAQGEPGASRLLERPERLEDGVVRVRMLLNPGVRVGRPVTIVSHELAGPYRVEHVAHAGDNRTGGFDTIGTLRVLT